MKNTIIALCTLFMIPVIQAQWIDNGNEMTTTDNIGIGIANPFSKLHIQSEGSFKSNAWFGKGFINNSNYHFDRARVGISGTTDSGQFGAGLHFQVRNNGNTDYLHAIIGQDRNGSLVFETGGAGINAPTQKMALLTNGNIGIGIANPFSKLHIQSEGSFKSNAWFGKGFINNSNYHFDRARVGISGTTDSGQFGAGLHFQVRNNGNTDYLHAIIGQDRNGSLVFETGGAGINAPTQKMALLTNGDVGIGTTTPDAKLTVKGDIHTQEVKVDLNGAVAPDYVFKDNYNLPSLEEVQVYIDTHGHLPNIPSAQKMEANGIELKAMNLKLLEKIEELTLYILIQQKEIEANKAMKVEMEELKKSYIKISGKLNQLENK